MAIQKISDFRILRLSNRGRRLNKRAYIGKTALTIPKACWLDLGMPEYLSFRSQGDDLVLFTLITMEPEEVVRKVRAPNGRNRAQINIPWGLKPAIIPGYYEYRIQSVSGYRVVRLSGALA